MTNTLTTLNGLFKDIYPDRMKWLMPKNLRLQTDLDFVPPDRSLGNQYFQPVVLRHEHGFTYARGSLQGAAGGTAQNQTPGAFALEAAVAGLIAPATVVGSQLLLRAVLDYEAASRASSGGKKAFVQATQYLVENMWQSARKRTEIAIIYGRTGLGTIAAVPVANVIVITTSEWAPGIWAGMENAAIEIFNPISETAFTKRVDVASITQVTAMNFNNRTITVNSLPTGATTGDRIFFRTEVFAPGNPTAHTHNTFLGIHKILTATTPGDAFGIDPAANSLWSGNSISAGDTNLSFETIQRAIALAVAKGLDEELCLYVAPITWALLLTDQAALRQHNDPNKRYNYEVGAEAITFYSMIGTIKIKTSIYVKEGYAILIAPALWHRVGSTDWTFRLPDRGDEFFRHLENAAGYELRAYTNQACFCDAIGKNVLITNIVNT